MNAHKKLKRQKQNIREKDTLFYSDANKNVGSKLEKQTTEEKRSKEIEKNYIYDRTDFHPMREVSEGFSH